MATFLFNPEGTVIKNFLSKKAVFSYETLLLFFLIWFLFTIVTYGTAVPAGLFLPGILIGCSLGRVLGLFIENKFAGEVNLNNVIRGAMQTGTVGYWIDRKQAGNGYVAEGVAVLSRFAFDELKLHRIEVCIIPRNTNSKKVVEKLKFRLEGLAERFLEINGVWEDHLRYGFTIEEWQNRKAAITQQWLVAKT